MVLWSMASGITTIPSQVTNYRQKRFLHLSKYVPAFAIIYMNREKNKTKQIGIFKFRIIYLELLQSHWEKQQVNWTHKFFNWFAWIYSHSKPQICFFFCSLLHFSYFVSSFEVSCCCCEVAPVMSDSVRPHRRQPTRLPRSWDSPGKNTGVGCHFLLQCMKVKSESEVAQSCLALHDPMDCSLPGSSIHGIFQARVLEWGATAFSTNNTANHQRNANQNHNKKSPNICQNGSHQKDLK